MTEAKNAPKLYEVRDDRKRTLYSGTLDQCKQYVETNFPRPHLQAGQDVNYDVSVNGEVFNGTNWEKVS